jgi:formate dehydrogenase iron-sulfur subunit
MSRACLIDTTRCIGCRACQVACKQWNSLPAEETGFFAPGGGYQNPPDLSSKTFTLVTFNEVIDKHGNLKWIFAKRQCMHCLVPACASACPVGALEKTGDGAVVYHEGKCIGCRYCMIACPFGVPAFEWEKTIPSIKKCTFCFGRRISARTPHELDGQQLSHQSRQRHATSQKTPACAKACPTGSIKFGYRDRLVKDARKRIKDQPDRYVHHIYGEKEIGGASWIYLSSVPFAQLGFRSDLGERPADYLSKKSMYAVPWVIVGVLGTLSLFHQLTVRRDNVGQEDEKTGDRTNDT